MIEVCLIIIFEVQNIFLMLLFITPYLIQFPPWRTKWFLMLKPDLKRLAAKLEWEILVIHSYLYFPLLFLNDPMSKSKPVCRAWVQKWPKFRTIQLHHLLCNMIYLTPPSNPVPPPFPVSQEQRYSTISRLLTSAVFANNLKGCTVLRAVPNRNLYAMLHSKQTPSAK